MADYSMLVNGDANQSVVDAAADVTSAAAPSSSEVSWRSSPRRVMLAAVGILCVVLGAIGIAVPGIPGTVFLLVASWCFAKSFPSLERRLLRNRFFAPYMRFVDGDAPLPRRDRVLSIALMWLSTIFSTWFLWWRQWIAVELLPLIPLAACLGTLVIIRRGRHVPKPGLK